MPTQTVIPSVTKIRLFAKVTTLSHPGIITPSVTKAYIFSKEKPPFTINVINFSGGAGNYALIPYNAEDKPSHAMTIEARVKLTVIATSQPQIAAMIAGLSNTQGWQFYFYQPTGNLYWQPFVAGAYRQPNFSTTTGGFDGTKLHHYAGTFDGRFCNLYVDGILRGSIDLGASGGPFTIGYAGESTTNMAIGANSPLNLNIDGSVGEFRIWSIARDPTDLIRNMWTSVPVTSFGLNAYYKLDEGSGSTVIDSSPYGHNGTLATGLRQILIYQPLKRNVQLINTQRPRTVGVLKTPSSNSIHISANTIKANRTQHPTTPAISITAHAPKTVGISKVYPARASIAITAHAPKSVSISKVYPGPTSIHISAHAPAKQILTQHPSRSVIHLSVPAPTLIISGIVKPSATAIHITAHAPKAVSISKIYPASTSIHITAHAPKSVSISRVYPSPLSIHLTAHAPAKINQTQKPSHSTIHIAVASPTIRLTQHVSRAVIHLALPPPKLILTLKPVRTIIHLSVPAPTVIFNQDVHPTRATITISARTPIVSTAFIRYRFTVKIRKNVNFVVKIPDSHP